MNRKLTWLLPTVVFLGLLALTGCPGGPLDNPGIGTPPLVPSTTLPIPSAGAGDYLFCFWNVENLFDDQNDARTTRGDGPYDTYFSEDDEARKQKLSNLADVLLELNDNKGPDILALAEVESDRAVELLQQTLNRRLDPKVQYHTRVYEDPNGSRHIGCAVLSRLPVVKDRTTVLGRRQRILETRLTAAGKQLVVVASHWSSRISDDDGSSRSKYADVIHGRFRGMYKTNPEVDFLVCGDFNDDPDDESVTEHLHATGDRMVVLNSGPVPMLYNLMVDLKAKGDFSHYYRKGYLFDQICVSPGMLDKEGWSVVMGTTKVIKRFANRNGHPNRFGSRSDRRQMENRGASDHFPVTVTLRVQ